MIEKIGFGGGCHWCTEAVFQSLKGVVRVEQGWIGSEDEFSELSEAVIVNYYPEDIPLKVLAEIHLRTHKSTSNHSMRGKYRSAIYVFNEKEIDEVNRIMDELQSEFKDPLITKVLPFKSFKLNTEEFRDYYKKNPQKPFCETYIHPKLEILMQSFLTYYDGLEEA